MKKLKIHKIANPKTIRILEELSNKKSYRKASQLIEEVYLDTNIKITGKHLIVGAGTKGKCTLMYIVEDADNPEILMKHWNELPDDLKQLISKTSGKFIEETNVVRYDNREDAKAELNREFEKDVNELMLTLVNHFKEKVQDPVNASAVLLGAYNMLVMLTAKDIKNMDKVEFLRLQVEQLRVTKIAFEDVIEKLK